MHTEPALVSQCVAGKGTKSPASLAELLQDANEKAWDETARRSKLLEEVVAVASYLPLSGRAFDTEVRV